MGYISNKRICRYINRHSFILISLLCAPDILCKKKKLYDTILTLIPIATVLIPFIHFRPHTCMNVHISNNLQKGCYTKYFSIHQNKWYIETLPLRIFCKILFFNAIIRSYDLQHFIFLWLPNIFKLDQIEPLWETEYFATLFKSRSLFDCTCVLA